MKQLDRRLVSQSFRLDLKVTRLLSQPVHYYTTALQTSFAAILTFRYIYGQPAKHSLVVG